MKKKLSVLSILVLILSILFSIYVKSQSLNNIKKSAVWITTIYNKDYPSIESRNNPDMQKEEFIDIIDKLKEAGITDIIFQVRPKGDALYKSKINPWSEVLTGVPGKHPGYDPLEFVLKESHKRNIKVHAWINPYRVTTYGTDFNKLSKDSFAYKNRNLVLEHNNALFLDPSKKEVVDHITESVEEIIDNYDIDGIHLDDYFYPSNYPLPEGETLDGVVANKRRENINNLVSGLYSSIKNKNKNIEFGISPMGIWKNKSNDKTGSDTRGAESYYKVYADTRAWISNGWVDYITPQVYWEIGHKAADYSIVVDWWNNEVNKKNVDLYIGHGLYKEEVSIEIDRQINLLNNYKNVNGSFYYSLNDMLNNNHIFSVIKKYNNNIFTDDSHKETGKFIDIGNSTKFKDKLNILKK